MIPRGFRMMPVAMWAIALLSGCKPGGSPDDAAARFMDELAGGRVAEAYAGAAPVFQFKETAASFEGRIREVGISRFSSVEWTGKSEGRDNWTYSGKLKSRTGRDFLIDMDLARSSGEWKVASFKFRPAEELGEGIGDSSRSGNLSFSETGEHELPSDAEVKHMARQSLMLLAKCVVSGDFEEFYGAISAVWQSQVSAVRLQRAFGRLAEQGGFEWVGEAEVQLIEPPVLNPQGLLIVQGRVEGAKRLEFLFRYNYELPDWKLFGVEATLAPTAEAGSQ